MRIRTDETSKSFQITSKKDHPFNFEFQSDKYFKEVF